MNDILKARQFAEKYHANQKYDIDKPYMYHILGVVNELKQLIKSYSFTNKYINDLFVCAYLHDIIEDTDITYDILQKHFDYYVINNIKLLTRDKNSSYFDYILKIKNSNDIGLLLIKIADLTFNISQSQNRKLNSYEKQRLDKYLFVLYIY